MRRKTREQDKEKKEIFLPYYINQDRLLDIYAIFNNGYSEYTEIKSSVSEGNEGQAGVKGNVSGGFRVFNFGADISGELLGTSARSREKMEKKVQTVTSILSIVKDALVKNGYTCDIKTSNPGSFICQSVTLSLNSAKEFLSEIQEVMSFMSDMKRQGMADDGQIKDLEKVDRIIKTIKVGAGGEEILFETDDYAIIGNIFDKYLYQSLRSDIIGHEINCLAQVKRIYPEGTLLLKNSVVSKIKMPSEKKSFFDIVAKLNEDSPFDFEATVVTAVEGKPVYQVEIIALYQ